jgi:glyoxylase-like metal-dependent hydrolase (beta-lactamase superfamily II)
VKALAPRRAALLTAAATIAAPWLRMARAADAPDTAVEVEAGVYMLPGAKGAASLDNLGRVGNAGFIVGRSGVIAIDSGTSHLHGQAILAEIAQVTPLPVRALLLTHVRQEFVFGASAFQARGVAVHMHQRAAALMAARCANCLKTLRAELGDEAMRGSVVAKPDVSFDATHVIESIGRPVLVQAHAGSSGPGDVAVFDVRTGTLFAGGLLDNQRIPDIQDGDHDAWRDALAALRTLRLATVVPGHGPAAAPALIDTQERYLVQLERRCAALLKSGVALSAVADAAELPEFKSWDQYDTIHRRNASVMFLRLERKMLTSETAPTTTTTTTTTPERAPR